jgi:hypothetical protein
MRLAWLLAAALCLALAMLHFRNREKYHEVMVAMYERLTPKPSTGLRESSYMRNCDIYGVSLILVVMAAVFMVAAFTE